jgi:hypothetical protein
LYGTILFSAATIRNLLLLQYLPSILDLSIYIFLPFPPFSLILSLSPSLSLSLSLSHSTYLSQVREQLLDLKENVLETVVLEVRTKLSSILFFVYPLLSYQHLFFYSFAFSFILALRMTSISCLIPSLLSIYSYLLCFFLTFSSTLFKML